MSREEMLKELIEEMSECGLFIGKYDAFNGSDKFMHGVAMVMEHLAYRVSDEYGCEFENKFLQNMIESEKKGIDKITKR